MTWGLRVSRGKLLPLEETDENVLKYSTGSYALHSVINHSGKQCKEGCVYAYNQITTLEWELAQNCKSMVFH